MTPVFLPVEINGNVYSDGGILNNFPIEPLQDKFKNIIGSFVNPISIIDKTEINSLLKLLYRVYHISLDANNVKKIKKCNDVFSHPNIEKIGVLDSKIIHKSYQMGYDFAKIEIKKNLKSLI